MFPPPLFFFCFETATALFHTCSTGNALGLGQGREKIKLESKPACCWTRREMRLAPPPLHLEPPSSPPNPHRPPCPPFLLCTSWGYKPFPPVRGLREWAECSCRLVLVSLDQGTLSPYLKTDSKAKLRYKSSSVLKVDSFSKD